MHNKVGSVFRANGGSRSLDLTPASCTMHDMYAVAW